MTFRFPHWCQAALLATFLLLFGFQANATHYRYGSLSWQETSTNVVEFKIAQAWRMSAWFSGTAPLGSSVYTGTVYFGDGGAAALYITVTSVNPADDWFFGEATLVHTYSGPGTYNMTYSSCCRISTLENNSDGSFISQSDVHVGSGNNSPVTTISPIVNLQANIGTATFQIPAIDPEGDALTFGDGAVPGYGTNSFRTSIGTSGLVSFNTNGTSVGELYNVIADVTDGQTTVIVDFIVKIVQQSNPPQWDYSVTPADNFAYTVAPGDVVTFDVKAFDTDPGSTVTLNGVGIPVGATMTPALPTTANPVTSTFSWTTTSSNLGTNVINFTATDDNGVQIATSVSIIVTDAPRFDIPPTPATATHNVIEPGNTLTFTAQASDPDPNDVVQIISAKHKMTGLDFVASYGATLTPALPTPAANPTSTVFSWTPTASQWGHNHVIFEAEDSYGDKATHEVAILVNTTPFFTSAPVTNAVAGQMYTYNITAVDPDIPYGDILDMILVGGLPSWLNYVDNGNGSATLSGTPTLADLGTTSMITIEAQDINHHLNIGGIPSQMFAITVTAPTTGCTNPADPSNLTVSTDTAFITHLHWDDNSNNEEGFKIYRVSNTGGTELLATVDPNVTSYTDMIVPYFGENVDYYVVAYDDNCESNASNTATYYQPTDLNRLRLSYVCYNANTDSLTWTVKNDGNYYRPVIWAQWWSSQIDTIWAAPNGLVSFKTKNNPQNGGTWGDDNITGIYYWVSYYVMKDYTVTRIDLNRSCSNVRMEFAPEADHAAIFSKVDMGIRVADVRGMGDELLRQNVQVSPNPTADRVYISSNGMDQTTTYKVMDAMGREFIAGSGNLMNRTELDMTGLAAGVYFLKLEAGGLSTTYRLIKN